MIDEVAKVLCLAASISIFEDPDRLLTKCSMCEEEPKGCKMWKTFRGEARQAIRAVYQYHKRERRWPEFCK